MKLINDKQYFDKSICLFDYGFENYDPLTQCIENAQKFAIRVKDTGSNGISFSMSIPVDECDIDINKS